MNFSGHFLPDLSPTVKSGFRVVVFVERGSPQPWRVGSRPNAQPAIPPKPFAPAIWSRCVWAFSNTSASRRRRHVHQGAHFHRAS